jgi:hypothetical protein
MSEALPLVRVFVPTYRRPLLLRRALESLLAQDFPDWVAEVHNDDPSDDEPVRLVAALGDARIRLVQHDTNWGALRSFNHFYASCSEPYVALLEDDNAWLPGFLSGMLAALARHPRATLAWCNQRVLEERPGNGWLDTGRTVNPREPGAAPRLVGWPAPRQALGALHANGSMLLRTSPARSYQTPLDLPFGGVEQVRERLTPHPLVYVPEVLACFSVTLLTAQSRERSGWGSLQTLLVGTYLRHAGVQGRRKVLLHLRSHNPLAMGSLIEAALVMRGCRDLLPSLSLMEWLRWLRSSLAHPVVTTKVLRCQSRHPEWLSLLDAATAERFCEASCPVSSEASDGVVRAT